MGGVKKMGEGDAKDALSPGPLASLSSVTNKHSNLKHSGPMVVF
jgi:hypothetical protein